MKGARVRRSSQVRAAQKKKQKTTRPYQKKYIYRLAWKSGQREKNEHEAVSPLLKKKKNPSSCDGDATRSSRVIFFFFWGNRAAVSGLVGEGWGELGGGGIMKHASE